MYASFDEFERNSRTVVVPSWFLRIIAPVLIILALPLAMVVLAVMLGIFAARAVLAAFRRPPAPPRAGTGGVLTDVDYVVVEERPMDHDSHRTR